jgi:hypothetical protein
MENTMDLQAVNDMDWVLSELEQFMHKHNMRTKDLFVSMDSDHGGTVSLQELTAAVSRIVR